MKTIAKTLLAALLLSTSTFAAHVPHLPKASVHVGPTAITTSYKVAIYPSGMDATKLNVMVERAPGQAMEVQLRDADGYVLATQYVHKKEGNVHLKFDLSELNDGEYKLDVTSGSDKTSHVMKLVTKATQSSRTIALN